MHELVLQAPESLVEAVSDALMEELDALSVSVEDSDADTDAMHAIALNPNLTAEERVQARYALGKALEDRGAWDESFEHYATGATERRARLRYDADQKVAVGE